MNIIVKVFQTILVWIPFSGWSSIVVEDLDSRGIIKIHFITLFYNWQYEYCKTKMGYIEALLDS